MTPPEPAAFRAMTHPDRHLNLTEITDPADPLLHGFWLPLYRRAFPPEEREHDRVVLDAVARPDRHLLVGVEADTGAPACLARMDDCRPDGLAPFAFLVYLATDDARRGAGLGGAFLERVCDFAAGRGAEWLILEAESPRTVAERGGGAEAVSLARRRLGFYERHGFAALSGVRYRMLVTDPPEDAPPTPEPLEMLLLARTLRGDHELTAGTVRDGAVAVLGAESLTPVPGAVPSLVPPTRHADAAG
jgi:GNAT superfamily N-acetyltransferase